MTHVEFDLIGDEALNNAMRQSIPFTLLTIGGALWREANSIMNDSVPLVPVRKGILKGSHVVLLPQVSGTAVEVVLGYGGAAEAYSVIQHERDDFNHRVGQAHYLSEPFAAHAATMEVRLAADIAATPLFRSLP